MSDRPNEKQKSGKNRKVQITGITGRAEMIDSLPESTPSAVRALVEHCLREHREERPTFKEAVQVLRDLLYIDDKGNCSIIDHHSEPTYVDLDGD